MQKQTFTMKCNVAQIHKASDPVKNVVCLDVRDVFQPMKKKTINPHFILFLGFIYIFDLT